MNANYISVGSLKVAEPLYNLVRDEIAPGTGVEHDAFWNSLSSIVHDLAPKNKALLDKRDGLQSRIDAWHTERRGQKIDTQEYKSFLMDIGYLAPEVPDFKVTPANVDDEIAKIAGPQLVVPVDNARFATNAANARWWSLYDSLYGTDMIPETDGAEKGDRYNLARGKKVISYSEQFLDEVVPLFEGSHKNVTGYGIKDADKGMQLTAFLGGYETGLDDASQFVGYRQSDNEKLSSILLRNNGLHIEIQIDMNHYVGKDHHASVKDVILESAITTIQDFEDAVSAVDVGDKVQVYKNWNGLMKGTLEEIFEKDNQQMTRRLNPDRNYASPDGSSLILPGRSLMLVRNVGIHMYTDAVTTADNQEIPEGFLDAMVASLAAMHDLKGNGKYTNSKQGSVYIVKPKLHGPEEVAATVELFGRVEQSLGLGKNTLKIGIMDEERRTTVNLEQCIYEARDRVIFINTGFLDRTGDEIHTSMEAGAMLPKAEIRTQPWIGAYEDWNVDIGIEAGLPGIAQIGKGMWAMPDEMRAMVETKINHPMAGANTAWVPSPTAATLHAMHYHLVNVQERQEELANRERASLDAILTPPLLDRSLNHKEIQKELENNAQSILGYVARWVGQGVGCSKVPDINNVALMEDRATLRISSQHIANWLYHNITNDEEVITVFKRMAEVVDSQNAGDENYTPMSPDYDNSVEFQAALDLVLKGQEELNGYTEPVLHRRRREIKQNIA